MKKSLFDVSVLDEIILPVCNIQGHVTNMQWLTGPRVILTIQNDTGKIQTGIMNAYTIVSIVNFAFVAV